MGIYIGAFVLWSIMIAVMLRLGYVWGWNAREKQYRDQGKRAVDPYQILLEEATMRGEGFLTDDQLREIMTPDDPKDLDRDWFDVLCPTCAFFNSVTGRQLRLEETIICTGCHESFRLKKGETMIKVHL